MRSVEKWTYLMTWICIVIGIFVIVATLTGCNRQVVDLEYTYNKAIIDGVGVVEVRSWCDYEQSDMIQVIGKEGNVYLTHSSKVVLIKE